MTADDAGWDGWDSDRVYGVLWPESAGWSGRHELWPATAVPPPRDHAGRAAPPVRASDVPKPVGGVFLTYWVWAVGTPFVKIGRTQYRAERDGRWRGSRRLVQRRIEGWATGCPWELTLLRFAVGDASSEGVEHRLRAAGRMPAREWFDLRQIKTREGGALERERGLGPALPGGQNPRS